MKNYFVRDYLHCRRELRKCTSISDCIYLSNSIGISIGCLSSSGLDPQAINRIRYKYYDLQHDVCNRTCDIACEMHNNLKGLNL